MDYAGLAITIGIVIYGMVEYRRREHPHNEAMAYLKHDLRPPDRTPKLDVRKLLTTGSVGTEVKS